MSSVGYWSSNESQKLRLKWHGTRIVGPAITAWQVATCTISSESAQVAVLLGRHRASTGPVSSGLLKPGVSPTKLATRVAYLKYFVPVSRLHVLRLFLMMWCADCNVMVVGTPTWTWQTLRLPLALRARSTPSVKNPTRSTSWKTCHPTLAFLNRSVSFSANLLRWFVTAWLDVCWNDWHDLLNFVFFKTDSIQFRRKYCQEIHLFKLSASWSVHACFPCRCSEVPADDGAM